VEIRTTASVPPRNDSDRPDLKEARPNYCSTCFRVCDRDAKPSLNDRCASRDCSNDPSYDREIARTEQSGISPQLRDRVIDPRRLIAAPRMESHSRRLDFYDASRRRALCASNDRVEGVAARLSKGMAISPASRGLPVLSPGSPRSNPLWLFQRTPND